MCSRKMADSGDGVNSTSSGKETRGTIADGPITDPASSMKVNQAELQSNLKSRAVPRAPSDVRVNLTAVCDDRRICRRSHDGVDRRAGPERATYNVTVGYTSRIECHSSCGNEKFRRSSLSLPCIYVGLFCIFLSFSLSVSLPFHPFHPSPPAITSALCLCHSPCQLFTCVFFCLAQSFGVL